MSYLDDRVHQLRPEILANAGNPNAPVAKREGYIGLFIFLPMTMKAEFVPLLEQALAREQYFHSGFLLASTGLERFLGGCMDADFADHRLINVGNHECY